MFGASVLLTTLALAGSVFVDARATIRNASDISSLDASLFKRISSTCSGTSLQTSCHNTTKQTNSCCFESPGVSAYSETNVLVNRSDGSFSRDCCFRHK